jgi:hypothetical protein
MVNNWLYFVLLFLRHCPEHIMYGAEHVSPLIILPVVVSLLLVRFSNIVSFHCLEIVMLEDFESSVRNLLRRVIANVRHELTPVLLDSC